MFESNKFDESVKVRRLKDWMYESCMNVLKLQDLKVSNLKVRMCELWMFEWSKFGHTLHLG